MAFRTTKPANPFLERQQQRRQEALEKLKEERGVGGAEVVREKLMQKRLPVDVQLKLSRQELNATKLKLRTAKILPIGSDVVRGETMSLLVTRAPTAESPYEFRAKLPTGREVPVVVSQNLWYHQMRNLGEGTSSVPVPQVKPEGALASDHRAVAASTVGQPGLYLMGKGELHPRSERYPEGVFLMGEVETSGPRPGEFRHHDPKFYETQGAAFAFDHLSRLFPESVQEDKQGLLFLEKVPTVADWKTFHTNFDFANRRRDAGSKARADVGAFARVVFDLMAAYQTTGDQKILKAAANAITAQRELFQVRGGEEGAPKKLEPGEILWKSNEKTLGSEVSDDIHDRTHAVPAYLQAYALSGISEYFAATHDDAALADIVGTLKTYQHHFKNPDFGWYRVIHPETLSGRDESLGDLKDFVAWNSIGDLDVAALFKLHAALGVPKPGESKLVAEARRLADEISFEASKVITERMYDEQSPLLQELFRGSTGDPVHDWRWQQENGVVGHNFKVAWNLVRFANHFRTQADVARKAGDATAAAKWVAQAARSEEVAFKVWDNIAKLGIDELNGAARDVLTRSPDEGLQRGSPWLPTRDFWHQEQVLLAALVLHSLQPENPMFADVANRVSMVWSTGFLDTDRQGPTFRTNDDLYKVVEGTFGDRGRADLGYHQGELAMLARAYTALYVTKRPVDLHLNLVADRTFNEVSVRPDVVQPGRFELGPIFINGEPHVPTAEERRSLQFKVPAKYDGKELHVQATVQPVGWATEPTTP